MRQHAVQRNLIGSLPLFCCKKDNKKNGGKTLKVLETTRFNVNKRVVAKTILSSNKEQIVLAPNHQKIGLVNARLHHIWNIKF